MNREYSINGQSPLRAAFDVYLHDKHAANDRIVACNLPEAQELLLSLRRSAPHAVAKALAVYYGWNADVADECEGIIQEQLPLRLA